MIKKSLKFGKNPDEIVKDSLRWISKFYPSMSPIINTIYPKEDKKIFTMAVTPSGSKGTLLLYNPEFVISSTEYFHDNLPDVNTKDYGKTIICNVSKHEIYHIMLNHIKIMIKKKYDIQIWNIATDTIINSQIEWGERQFTIHGAFEYDSISKKDLADHKWVSYDHLSKTPFWHCFAIDVKSKRPTPLVSPASIWFSLYLNIAENIKIFLDENNFKYLYFAKKDYYKQKSDSLKYINHTIALENGSVFFDIKGFHTKNSPGLFNEEQIKKANEIWKKIIGWLDTYVIYHAAKNRISQSEVWYTLYKELFLLKSELIKTLEIKKPQKEKLPKSNSFKNKKISDDNDRQDQESDDMIEEGDSSSKSDQESDEEKEGNKKSSSDKKSDSENDESFDDEDDDENGNGESDGEDSEDEYDEFSEDDEYNETEEEVETGIGEETDDCVNDFLKEKFGDNSNSDSDGEFDEEGGFGWSDSIKQFEIQIFGLIKEDYHSQWEHLLSERIGKSTKYKLSKTFYRPNKRWGEVFPGSKKKYEGIINIAIDTSGSVNNKTLSSFFEHLIKQSKKNKDLQYNLVLYNSIVYQIIYNWKPKDGMPNIKKSGTNFRVAIDSLYELFKINKGLNIMFTDGECECPLKKNYSTEFANNMCWVIWPGGDAASGKWGDIIKMDD
jgi:predicted metal-dependent peptidase